ncbi:DUF4893 domain-containing protein [Sphingosinicella rhizophila]|uniref:DUF4893 domain-containing protein n=1 Tax=Sphingosinicella rhizophila TaxID=3050082 RepID=A0ABU3Q703_9SPHN|nr:DUF4893 domain-containing protein [Sphingosinicella sp. GR2756]MDT9599171.1 DUF4893 domain-containing protein [Sphingosinicella sp. GR2756]
MKNKALFLPLALLLTACASDGRNVGPGEPQTQNWRSIATARDRERLREWRTAWVRALAKSRAAGHGAEISKEGMLLQPDAALPEAALPTGDYRCRTIKIGAKSEGLLDYVAYPPFDCRVTQASDGLQFVKLTGSQRPVGRLFPENDRRMIFLGTLQLGDEKGVFSYSHDRERDMAGLVERIGESRWRLVLPYPSFESLIDVIELVPSR